MSRKFTPWFPHTTPPVRSGPYQIKVGEQRIGYAYWCHRRRLWGFAMDFPEYARPPRDNTMALQHKDWRGLTK